MKKQSPIEIGSAVYWRFKILPDMEWIAKLDGKVTAIDGDKATIAVRSDCTISAEVKQFTVPLAELENKAWEIDREAELKAKADRRAKATVVEEKDWTGLFIDPEFDRYYFSSSEYLEHCESEDIDPEEYLFCVRVSDYQGFDSGSMCDRLSDDFDDDTIENLKGLKELDEAIEKFYKLNNLQDYTIDYTKIIEVRA